LLLKTQDELDMTIMRHILISFICLFYTSLYAQNDYHFEHITINNGLPHSTVYRVLQDQKGFMWFGTQRGLVRYDGYECRVWQQVQDGSNLLGKSVHGLLEDKKGNLWVGTYSGSLCVRQAETGIFQCLTTDTTLFKPLIGQRVQTIFEDKMGKIWIGTLDNGIVVFDPTTSTTQHFNQQNSRLSNNAVFAFAQDKSGRIWVATSGEGINYFDENTHTFQQQSTEQPNLNGYQKTLLLDKKNNLWIGSDGTGLYKMDLSTNVMQHFVMQPDGKGLNAPVVMSLALTKEGNVLIATDGGGLNVLNPETNVFHAFKAENTKVGALNTNALFDVCIDDNQNIWLATFNGGVNVYKAHQVRFDYFSHTGNRTDELSNRSILGFCQTTDGNIWIGTDGGGLNVLDRKTNRFSVIKNDNKVQNTVVKTIFEDKQKRLWLGYFHGGLALYDRKNGKFQHYLNNASDSGTISNNSVWSIAEDFSGQLWVGTLGNGINLFDPTTQKFQRFCSNSHDTTSLSHDGIMVVFADKKNNIWVGTEHSGLNLYHRDTHNFTRFQHHSKNAASISNDYIRAIFEDSRGQLWVATEGGGVNLWLGMGKFKHFTTQNGLISDAIMGISEDKNGYLWLSSLEGISRFDTEKGVFENFKFNKTLNGMSNQFNQAAILRTQEGEIMFGGINGLHIIHPEKITANSVLPQVVFTDFKVFDATILNGILPDGRVLFQGNISETRKIALSYQDNAFSIGFAALDFTAPSRNQYAFKMEGFDKEWHYNTAEQRLVTYTNLDAGTYNFRVRGTNSSGVWSGNEAAMQIVIHPPFWKTIWFRLLMFLLGIGIAFAASRIYLARREAMLRQRVLESEQAVLSLQNEQLASGQKILNLKNQQLEAEQEILSLQNEQLAANQVILTLQNEKLGAEITTKNNELMSKAVQMAHKNELLVSIKNDLDAIKTASETDRTKSLRALTRMLESEIENKESWEQFLSYFEEVNYSFINQLQTIHPNLTQNDRRMCALIRLNMSNREIATLLNISIPGVEKSRYRLKKRLDLTIEEDLSRYLMSL
jgi:ligand-binding sensor domain-containing protein/DNA-binding CsgD family transcriptional regulator